MTSRAEVGLAAILVAASVGCGGQIEPEGPVAKQEARSGALSCLAYESADCTRDEPTWHTPADTSPTPTYSNSEHVENFDYSNGCFGACGADCSQCSTAPDGHTRVCNTSPACQWHDTCYMQCNGGFWCMRACDIGCVSNFGTGACLGGLQGYGDYVACFDPSCPNQQSWQQCTDSTGQLFMNEYGQYYDPMTGDLDRTGWPSASECPRGYIPSGPGTCTFTVDTGCIGGGCVSGAGGGYDGSDCGAVSAIVGFNYCAFLY